MNGFVHQLYYPYFIALIDTSKLASLSSSVGVVIVPVAFISIFYSFISVVCSKIHFGPYELVISLFVLAVELSQSGLMQLQSNVTSDS